MLTPQQFKKLDIALLIVFPILAVALSLAFDVNYFVSTILFFGVPAAYFSWRTPHMVGKTALFSLIMAVPLTIIVDYLAIKDGSWIITRPAFQTKFLGLIPIDDFVWGYLHFYFVIIFYEHFLHHGKHELVDRRMKYIVWPLIILLIVFFVLLLTNQDWLHVPYFYLWSGGIVAVLPVVTTLSFFPRLLSKYVKTASYFFFVLLLFELTALQLKQWAFPGDRFIGWVSVLGHSFPLEEFFFWMMLGAIAMISYYEFFDEADRGNPLH